MEQMFHPTVLSRIECSGASVSPADKINNFKLFWNLTTATASERAWFQLHYSHTLPEMLAGILSKNQGDREDCVRRFVRLAQMVEETQQIMDDPLHDDRVATRPQLTGLMFPTLLELSSLSIAPL